MPWQAMRKNVWKRGVNDYLTKPVNPEDLLAAIERNVLRSCLKITYFTQFKVLSEEFNPQNTCVFLRLNSSSALNLNKLSNFQTDSETVELIFLKAL
jgi:DNA-binding response OmpR family regulator